MKDKILNRFIFVGYLFSRIVNTKNNKKNIYYSEDDSNKKKNDLILNISNCKIIKNSIECIYSYLNRKFDNIKIYEDQLSPYDSETKNVGNQHILTKTYTSISDTLKSLGFDVVAGPEVEHCFYNFDKLNIEHDHTSRGITDTFYLKNNVVLRTHTSSLQSRILLISKGDIPIRISSYGKVFRRDTDKTHSPMFHQLEGLYINKNVGFSELKGTLTEFIHKFFDQKINIRWRSSFFPFTEPSCEIDIECLKCKSNGCDLCKGSGWIEVMGAGLVNQNVLKHAGIDYKKYSGFAFGLGIERFSMIKYNLHDIKVFTDNILQEVYTF
jgi:phenylalanyl-tRNA synthetase alpha chain